MQLSKYLPQRVNSGSWVTWYTLDRLRSLASSTHFTLPICSLGTPAQELHDLGGLVLPPLYHEALDDVLKQQIVTRIKKCFPYYEESSQAAGRSSLKVIEIPPSSLPPRPQIDILAFSVDTAVEEHGPHLPLATDTVQSYAVLSELASIHSQVTIGPPVEYGQLTWGLPYGFSVDLTADLLTRYVSGFANALSQWTRPQAMYVVDVHGSIVHRRAIVDGMKQSQVKRWAFRWLHEPLVEFASARGDQHAGGVETALVEFINPDLLDADWWPGQIEQLAADQMSFQKAVELTTNLSRFIGHVEEAGSNGIVGDIKNYQQLDAQELFRLMLDTADQDVSSLLQSSSALESRNAGNNAW